MMNKKKILFTDLDGTLLDDRKAITSGNRKAIEDALAAGHKIVISTGRPLKSAIILSEELGLTMPGCYAITFNGGVIYDMAEKKTLFKKTFPKTYVRYIFDRAREHNLHCQTYAGDFIVSEHDTQALRDYENNTNLKAKIIPDVMAVLVEDPVKIIVIDRDHERLAAFEKDTISWSDGKLDRIFSCNDYLEYFAPGISKGNAIRHLCSYLNIPMDCTIAAGDEQNDISMIQAAAVGAVMQNAPERIKAIGNYITVNDNNNDGIAEIIEKFML